MNASEIPFTWAQRYCAALSNRFPDMRRLSLEDLNEVTDNWVNNAALEITVPEVFAWTCMLSVTYLNEDWILPNFEWVFLTMRLESVTGRLALFKYLLWRYERYAVDHPELFHEFSDHSPQYSDVEDSAYESPSAAEDAAMVDVDDDGDTVMAG
ncbi:hypothetical protein F4679DRAFT_525914 [Xylaria curta]|nr:hypothetical protein F4679DRAFT_525914 [Xylaria curta]